MDRCVGAAVKLPESDRQSLAIQALARSTTISDLATRHGVSRKFIYQQTDKARTALDDAFLSVEREDEVLFQLTVTKRWLRQVIVGLTLMCRSSYRGVIEFLRDLLGVPISIGTVHGAVQKVLLPGYTENRQSRAGQGIPSFECNPDLNHAQI